MCLSASVCQSVPRLRPAKTAKRIDSQFRVETLVGTGNVVLDGSPGFPHVFNAAFAKLL